MNFIVSKNNSELWFSYVFGVKIFKINLNLNPLTSMSYSTVCLLNSVIKDRDVQPICRSPRNTGCIFESDWLMIFD